MPLRRILSVLILLGTMTSAIKSGGEIWSFIDLPSILIIVGVVLSCTVWSFPLKHITTAFSDSYKGYAKDDNTALQNHRIFNRMADLSVIAGFVGTIIGLVLMLQNLEDPSAIGPAMAVALLTMFYGTILGELVFRSLATNCINPQKIDLQRTKQRGFSTVYLTMLSLFMLLTCFAFMLLAMM